MTKFRARHALLALALAAAATTATAASPASGQSATCLGEDVTHEAEPGIPLVGTDGDDVILGTPGPDVISGGAGNDIICGLGGRDVIRANAGRDQVDAGSGSDIVSGGAGSDVIDGGTGRDNLRGNSGNDTINGQGGRDLIKGGTGNDTIDGGPKADTIEGNGGRDTITGGKAGDTIDGGPKRDTIDGDSGRDTLKGNGGRDTINGGTGHDTLDGGKGRDLLDGGPGRDTCINGRGATVDASCLEGLGLTLVADLGDRAGIALAPLDDGRLFAVEQYHGIRVVKDGELLDRPFLNLEDLVSEGNEQGVLGLAFHPDYADNGRFFVSYTAKNRDNHIVEYRVRSTNPDRADAGTARRVLEVDQPHRWHNGGMIAFGPDGYLYIGIGDGGPGDDPNRTGQDTTNMLSSLLRIDVDGAAPYEIPDDNPFLGNEQARDEIWAYGLRNPWRFSFDEQTNRLFIGDVGQYNFDEINTAPIGKGGINYGWSTLEGNGCFRGSTCDASGIRRPTLNLPHTTGVCSVIGGYVYRGEAIPELDGHYFWSDFCLRTLNTLVLDGKTATDQETWLTAPASIGLSQPIHEPPPGGVPTGSVTSLGVDNNGELYVSTIGGAIYKIEPVR